MTLPETIRDTLTVHWPSQFTVADDATPTMRRVFARSLASFARNVGRITDKGVGIDQLEACLDQIANEPGYRRLDRGSILKRLWELVPDGKADRVPRVEVGERDGERNPPRDILPPDALPIRAIREAGGNKNAAVAACPMLGRPHPKHGRMIDMPLFDDECRRARGEKPRWLPASRTAAELATEAARLRRVVPRKPKPEPGPELESEVMGIDW